MQLLPLEESDPVDPCPHRFEEAAVSTVRTASSRRAGGERDTQNFDADLVRRYACGRGVRGQIARGGASSTLV